MRAVLAAVILFALAMPVLAAVVVVETNPANSARDVDPAQCVVTVVFSEPLRTDSWSLVKSDKGTFPELVGDPTFPDPTRCEIRVKLKPAKRYAIGINSPSKKGFVSAADSKNKVEPYVLVFSTGGAFDSAAPSTVVERAPSSRAVSASTPTGKSSAKTKTVAFQMYRDKTEDAFTALIPKGWKVEGGIVRVDPTAAGGPANAIEAKFDFAVKKDDAGTVMIRWLPHTYFADLTGQIAAPMFPTGSNYNGMTVCPVMDAKSFLLNALFPNLRPGAQNVKVVDTRDLPSVAAISKKISDELLKSSPIPLDFQYSAAMATVNYDEDGKKYKEVLFTAIEDRGRMVCQWSNRNTVCARAPFDEYDSWEAIGKEIGNSIQFNAKWVLGEIQGQVERNEIVARTQADIQAIEKSIAENRQKVNSQINRDMYETLTDNYRYKNPYTGKVEIGSGLMGERYQNDKGDVVYTQDVNVIHDLKGNGFKLTTPMK